MFCVMVLVGAVCSIIVYRLTFEALIGLTLLIKLTEIDTT